MTAYQEKFINVNEYSRPGMKLTDVRKLVLHYTANNGAGAENHYKYIGNLKDRYASAHIFVDKDEALNIIPLNEVAYHANDIQKYVNGQPYRGISELKPNANYLSIGVEMCLEKDGSFHKDTIERTENVFVELCKKFKLDPIKDIVRHFDVTSKNCPAPWVKNTAKFTDFKKAVKAKLDGKKDVKVEPVKEKVKSEVIKSPSKSNTSFKGKRLECIYAGSDGVNFYSKASWDKKYKVGIVTKGLGFPTIIDKVKVDGSEMYKVKNSKGATYYITASSKYVKVEGETKKTTTNTVKKETPKKKYIQLPKTSDSWRVYPLDKAPTKGNEKGFLNPKKFGGLEYEILGTPQVNVYTIKSGDFGKVNIYGASSTGAKIVTK